MIIYISDILFSAVLQTIKCSGKVSSTEISPTDERKRPRNNVILVVRVYQLSAALICFCYACKYLQTQCLIKNIVSTPSSYKNCCLNTLIQLQLNKRRRTFFSRELLRFAKDFLSFTLCSITSCNTLYFCLRLLPYIRGKNIEYVDQDIQDFKCLQAAFHIKIMCPASIAMQQYLENSISSFLL